MIRGCVQVLGEQLGFVRGHVGQLPQAGGVQRHERAVVVGVIPGCVDAVHVVELDAGDFDGRGDAQPDFLAFTHEQRLDQCFHLLAEPLEVTLRGVAAPFPLDMHYDDDGTVTPIATATSQPGEPIKVGKGAWTIAITPDGTTVYVVNSETSTVTPISTVTERPGKPIKVGITPVAIAIAP